MSNPKVLIVEDETIVALDIKRTLERLNFDVTDMASSYEQVFNSIKNKQPDIILMDINLNSNKDGIEITHQIQKKSDIPVIYLTAYTNEDIISRAIKTNPVSYLLKPFKADELKSNILLGLYKSKSQNSFYTNKELINLGHSYYYDYDNRKLYFKEQLLKLSKKEDILLKLLIDSGGNTVEFEDLENNIWPNMTIANSTLRTLIYRLRTKLNYNIIESIPMIGCRLNC